MDSYIFLYLITRLSKILFVNILGIIGSFVWLVFLGILWITEPDNPFIDIKKFTKRAFISLIICLSLCVIIPNEREFAFIYVVPKLVKNEKITNIPDKILDIANLYIDNKLKELTNGKSKK